MYTYAIQNIPMTFLHTNDHAHSSYYSVYAVFLAMAKGFIVELQLRMPGSLTVSESKQTSGHGIVDVSGQ